MGNGGEYSRRAGRRMAGRVSGDRFARRINVKPAAGAGANGITGAGCALHPDRFFAPDIERATELLAQGALLQLVPEFL